MKSLSKGHTDLLKWKEYQLTKFHIIHYRQDVKDSMQRKTVTGGNINMIIARPVKNMRSYIAQFSK